MSIPQPLAAPAVEEVAVRSKRMGGGAGHRLFVLALAGLAWIIPALWNPTFLYGLLVWDALLAAAYAIDWLRLPRPQQLRIRRQWQTPLSIGAPCQLSLVVENDSTVDLRIVATDDLPVSRWHTPQPLALLAPAGQSASVSCSYTPSQRGDLAVGQVYLRYRTAFDMAEKWAKVDLRQTVRVYPNFEHARKHAVYLARSRQIEMQMRMIRMRGIGSNFESLRDYLEGDELRNVCWTASARRGKLVTKTYQVERSQAVWLVLDCGRLMRARTEGYSKLDRAVDAALCLTQLALYSGDRVALLSYGRGINQRVMPGRGATQLRYLVEQLAVVREEAPEADHTRAAATLMSLQKRRGLVIWITDLAESAMTPEVIQAAGHLLSRHLLLFLVMEHTEIKRRAADIPASAEDMYEVVAAQEVVYRRELLLGRLRERGAFCLEVAPAQLSAAILNQYLSIKERNLV
ncbi:MAG: DUF58 domain-containing protein [Acidobacteriia bacterium]|nr:DUF58 domain-containing protein [Terriglobia bacterium]